MAPFNRALSIDPNPEYEEFISKLRKFHAERGTDFDAAPRVGNHRVDLLRLYNRVTQDGGYDAVSDTKANKLAWRKIGEEFRLGSQVPTLAFTLKTAYYKNLVAYEIKYFHNEEPPPKEIVEDQSARGGDVRKRTLENYERPPKREVIPVNGFEDDSGNEAKAAKVDGNENDEHGNLGVRSTRGLREAPPQRQLFQSDMASTRSTRNMTSQTPPGPAQSSHHTIPNGVGAVGFSDTLRDYEPKPPIPMAIKPVSTPATNPDAFKTDSSKDGARQGSSRLHLPHRAGIPPGFGHPGPNIYMRTSLALMSGIMEEQDFALHHLVKISYERGDKFRFASFPGMAEALMNKIIEIGPLLENEIRPPRPSSGLLTPSPSPLKTNSGNELSVAISRKRKLSDRLETEAFSRRLQQINEAGLAFRNLILQEENAEYVAQYPESRELLILLLSLPRTPQTVEIKHYGLEIAEHLTRYYSPSSEDKLFIALLEHVESTDRGIFLTAVRAICRLGSNFHQSAKLNHVPTAIVQRMCDYMLVEDEELRTASLDFIYQFTAVPDNVERMLHEISVDSYIKQLSRLLLYCPRVDTKREGPNLIQQPKVEPVETPATDVPIPRIPQDLIDQLLTFDEPDRSSQWLRCCFVEYAEGEITQIALWQAYQVPFGPYATQRPMLPAKDFITNVSQTFKQAQAQVIHHPAPRFIIKGIRPRVIPVNTKNQPFMRCLWHTDDTNECGEFCAQPSSMWEHVVTKHLHMTRDTEGNWDCSKLDQRTYSCRWADCTSFHDIDAKTNAFIVGMHLKTHLPDASERAFHKKKHNRTNYQPKEPQPSSGAVGANAGSTTIRTWQWQTTIADERGDATGLPLLSSLVLRNLARNIPKTSSGSKPSRNGDEPESLVYRLFAPVREQLYHTLAHNVALKRYLPELIRDIERGNEVKVDTDVAETEDLMPAFGT